VCQDGYGQTSVDLRTQSRNVDFSAAHSTKPLKTGTSLPTTCSVGEMFFRTDSPPGKNLYGCTATNTWSVLTSGSYVAGAGIVIGGSTISIEDAVVPLYYTGSGAPTVACLPGRDFYTDITNGGFYFCKAVNVWQLASSSGHTHSAGEINTGTLDVGRLPGVAVRSDQANAYSAGQKQTFQASATTAGLNAACAALPTAPANGDIVCDSGDSNKVKVRSNGSWVEAGGGNSGYNPLDFTTVSLEEHFICTTETTGQMGALGWRQWNFGSPTGHSFSCIGNNATVAGLVGDYLISSGTVQDAGTALSLGGTGLQFYGIGAVAGWEVKLRVRLVSTTAVAMFVGFTDTASGTPTNAIWFRYDTAMGDSNYMYQSCASSTCTTANSGIAADTSYHVFRLRATTPGQILFSIDSGSETALSTNVPGATTPLGLVFAVVSRSTTSKSIRPERMAFKWTGL